MEQASLQGRTLVLMASARTDGDTAAVAERLVRLCSRPAEVVALAPLDLQPFCYDRAGEDAFVTVVQAMAGCGTVVFATPLYWYAMSGVLKTFFDRLTDLLVDPTKRPLGRALAGRDVWALVVGTDPEPPTGVAEPFRLTASYFDMTWRGLSYVRAERGGGLAAEELARVEALAGAIDEARPPNLA